MPAHEREGVNKTNHVFNYVESFKNQNNANDVSSLKKFKRQISHLLVVGFILYVQVCTLQLKKFMSMVYCVKVRNDLLSLFKLLSFIFKFMSCSFQPSCG